MKAMNNEIIISLSEYALSNNISNMSEIEVFNKWSEINNIIVEKALDAEWIIDFIRSLKKIDKNSLKNALLIDEKYN